MCQGYVLRFYVASEFRCVEKKMNSFENESICIKYGNRV